MRARLERKQNSSQVRSGHRSEAVLDMKSALLAERKAVEQQPPGTWVDMWADRKLQRGPPAILNPGKPHKQWKYIRPALEADRLFDLRILRLRHWPAQLQYHSHHAATNDVFPTDLQAKKKQRLPELWLARANNIQGSYGQNEERQRSLQVLE